MLLKAGRWIQDYVFALNKQSHAFIFRNPPRHYLGYVNEHRSPIILIPGIYEKWHFLKAIADPLSLAGHSVYVVKSLGYNLKSIPASAKLIRMLIDEEDLRNVTLIAHSKGGLIGKYLLAFENHDKRIRKLIAIATPFSGSHIVNYVPHAPAKEIHPESDIIVKLQSEKSVNQDIVSICGTSDGHLWPETSCHLDGAQNVKVAAHGHHQVLRHPETLQCIHKEIHENG